MQKSRRTTIRRNKVSRRTRKLPFITNITISEFMRDIDGMQIAHNGEKCLLSNYYNSLVKRDFERLQLKRLETKYCLYCGTRFSTVNGNTFCNTSCHSKYLRAMEKEERIRRIKENLNKDDFKEFQIMFFNIVNKCIYLIDSKYRDKYENEIIDRHIYYMYEKYLKWDNEGDKSKRLYCYVRKWFAMVNMGLRKQDKERYIMDCGMRVQNKILGVRESV